MTDLARASRHSRRIPVAGPWVTQREVDAVAHAAATAWYEHANDDINGFEAEFAARTGRRHAIALPSCTSGLHLCLMARGIGPGDEVIVPETTWIATAAPIVYVGATPVFVDVDPEHWCLDTEATAAAINERTKAIIPVDLYGGFPSLVELEELADRHDIALIEDSAEAAGGSHQGREAGSFGIASTFSFHGSKTLTTGEGGMVLCDDDDLWQRMLFLRDHGRLPGDVSFRSVEVAWKYKMSALQAAFGRVQLARLDELIDRKREIFSWYQEDLAGLPLRLNAERDGDRCTFWMVTIVVDADTSVTAADLAGALDDGLVSTRPFFPPLSALDAFRDSPDVRRAERTNFVSRDLAGRSINLPSALLLEREDVTRVCEIVARCLS